MPPGGTGFGVYVHVPFCRARCDYCAFATFTDRDHLMEAYVSACRAELARAVECEGIPPATSLYVGGGTPSRLPADLLAALVEAVPLAGGAEVTVECNPEDAAPERLGVWRAAGVNRVSLGIQSTVPHVLEGLGRRHGTVEVGDAVAAVVEAGFQTWNADLIIGGAGESDADWDKSLAAVVALGPPHVSAYLLTVEPGTPLASAHDRHPADDVLASRYERTDEVLTANGYEWEELSNWARPGHGCRHNQLTWAQGDYRGIGSAAHSHRSGRRWWNVRTPDRYVALIGSGHSAESGAEVLTPEARALEALALGLRTPLGVPASSLPELAELSGLVARQGGRAVLTVRGRLLADAVTRRLVVGAGALHPAGTIPPDA